MSFGTPSRTPFSPSLSSCPNFLATTKPLGRGRGRLQPLCSPRGVDLSKLSLPVAQDDPTVKVFEAGLSGNDRACSKAESYQMYQDILRRADNATEVCKVRERIRLRGQPHGPGAKCEHASRIEAKLSRYRKDVYIVALQEELKRLTTDFTVLKQFAKKFVQEDHHSVGNPNGTDSSNSHRENAAFHQGFNYMTDNIGL